MNETDRIVKKFRDAPGPVVVMTPAEHQAFCLFYGAVKPNDYGNPFMGKIIEIREPEFVDEMPIMPEEAYEAPIGPTFIPEDDELDTFLPAPVDDLASDPLEEVDTALETEAVIEEDPYA